MPLTVSKGLNAGRSLTRALTVFSSRSMASSYVRMTARLLLHRQRQVGVRQELIDLLNGQTFDPVGAE